MSDADFTTASTPTPTTIPLTMSSLEIAGLTGKRHDHVLRDIRKALTDLDGLDGGSRATSPQFWGKVPSGGGRPMDVAHLPKRESLILVSGYSIELRARIIDRWQSLEAMLAQGTPAFDMKAVGGMVKGILAKQLNDVIPSLVAAEVAHRTMAIRRGKTAGQIWKEAGFPPIRIGGWFSRKLREMGCEISGGGCGELGLATARLFDPDKATAWLRNGGRMMVETKLSERMGQGRLKLVQGAAL